MGEMPEWCRKDNEQGGWHDETIFIHGQVVVDAVEQEMQGYTHSVIREMVV